MHRRPLTRLLTSLVVLLAPGAALLATSAPASAGQVGLTVGIEGAGAVTVVEGTLEDGAPTTCARFDNQDHRVTVWCDRVRNEEPFEAWVWLRPTAAPDPQGQWQFQEWSGCDRTRAADGLVECAVHSTAFGSVETSPVAHFRDVGVPTVTDLRATQVPSVDGAFDFAFTVAGGTAACRIQGQADFWPCASPVRRTLPEGHWSFQVRASDSSGNVGAAQTEVVSLDTVIMGRPDRVTQSTTAVMSFSSQAAEQFYCSLDEAAFTLCGDRTRRTIVLEYLEDGPHRFRVYGRTGSWVDQVSAEWRWTVDATAPTPTTLGGDVRGDRATFTFANPDASSFRCRIDRPSGPGTWGTCTSPVVLGGLEQGQHSIEVQGIDEVGNIESPGASRRWTVDTVAPTTTLTAATSQDAAAFTFAAPGAVRFECRLSGPGLTPAWQSCSSPTTFQALATGEHVLEVRAHDAAGNVEDPAARHAWTAVAAPTPNPAPGPGPSAPDTTAPDTTVLSGPSGFALSSSAAFELGSEPGAGFRCALDARSTPCGATLSLAGLGAGTHTLTVAAVDAAGNADATPVVRTWTVPRTARALPRARGWSRRAAPDSYGGTQLLTTTKGARLSTSVKGARSVALVVSTGRRHGTVRVYAGSRLLRTVRLASATSRHRVVVPVATFARAYTGALRVVATTSGRRIEIEGLGVATG